MKLQKKFILATMAIGTVVVPVAAAIGVATIVPMIIETPYPTLIEYAIGGISGLAGMVAVNLTTIDMVFGDPQRLYNAGETLAFAIKLVVGAKRYNEVYYNIAVDYQVEEKEARESHQPIKFALVHLVANSRLSITFFLEVGERIIEVIKSIKPNRPK